MPKRRILLFIFTIAILHSPIISAQKVKERAMVVYSKKTKEPGTGIRTYFGENFTMFPLFGELRGYWKRILIYSRGGYSLSTSGNNDRGGAYASIGLGLNFISKTRYKLFFSMGYEFQDHRRKDTSVLRKEILTGKNGIAIRIGTQF